MRAWWAARRACPRRSPQTKDWQYNGAQRCQRAHSRKKNVRPDAILKSRRNRRRRKRQKDVGLFIFKILCYTKNFDQNVCPVREDAPTYTEKFFIDPPPMGKHFKSLKTSQKTSNLEGATQKQTSPSNSTQKTTPYRYIFSPVRLKITENACAQVCKCP